MDEIKYNIGDIVTRKNKQYEILYIYDTYYVLKSLSDNSTILLFESEFKENVNLLQPPRKINNRI